MAIIDYPNLTECLSTDGFPDRADGWFLKHLDTGFTYHRVSGAWVSWGLGLSFAPPTKSGVVTTDINGQAEIVFGTPFYDNAYTIALSCGAMAGETPIALFVSKSADRFAVQTVDSKHGRKLGNVVVSWLTTRNFNA